MLPDIVVLNGKPVHVSFVGVDVTSMSKSTAAVAVPLVAPAPSTRSNVTLPEAATLYWQPMESDTPFIGAANASLMNVSNGAPSGAASAEASSAPASSGLPALDGVVGQLFGSSKS